MKDHIAVGVALGTVFPVLACLVANFTNINTNYFSEKPLAVYVLAVAINLITIRFIYRSGREATAKGIMLITFVAMVVAVLLLQVKV